MGKILLYYKYISIAYPKRILKWQRKICTDLGLRGRIFMSHEGINGTVGGDAAAIDHYMAIMRKHELFSDIDFKESLGHADYFPRMEIKVKDEICKLGIDPKLLTIKAGGTHVTPEQAHKLMQEKPEDLVILDARNNFESRIGTFTGSVIPDIKYFRDFPKFIDENLEQFKGKRVLMHCTGGIRCERASAYLKTKGIAKEVMQIQGGIIRYTERYPDGFFRGKNYVFDRRVALRVNDDVLSECDLCQRPSDDYTNCCNAQCNKHYICCPTCLKKYGNNCSDICLELVNSGNVPVRSPFTTAPEQQVTKK